MKFFATLMLLCAVSPPAAAKKKPLDYQDGVLQSFHYGRVGTTCSHSSDTKGNIDADTNGRVSDGNVSAQTDGTVTTHTEGITGCQDNMWIYYTISVGSRTYVVHPDQRLFNLPNVLTNKLPGTHVGIRTDKHHFYVSIDGKESKFMLIEAH